MLEDRIKINIMLGSKVVIIDYKDREHIFTIQDKVLYNLGKGYHRDMYLCTNNHGEFVLIDPRELLRFATEKDLKWPKAPTKDIHNKSNGITVEEGTKRIVKAMGIENYCTCRDPLPISNHLGSNCRMCTKPIKI